MSDFKRLSDTVWASPQIDAGDVADAAQQGFTMIVNNRPDAEQNGQPSGAQIEQSATANGLSYVAIPIDHAGFSQPQVDAMVEALDQADGKVLAYCRSGTRSTFLWALAQAHRGEDPSALTEAALATGYDITAIVPMLEMLSAKARD